MAAMGRTLFEKVWDAHAVRTLPNGQTQLFVGLHLVHEVTSPQAFADLDARGWRVRAPQRTFATVDHIVPTRAQARPFADPMAETMTVALERNCAAHGIPLFDVPSGAQGIVHVIGPELGLTQPGMTMACGDSHTSTHGAFGALAFGIGTSQVRDVLASQCVALSPLKVRRIEVTGPLAPGVYAKDVILAIIGRLGVQGGAGYAYEYAGDTIERMSMDERMTVCNMSIEGGARIGYVNPDATTFAYLEGRRFAPAGEAFGAGDGLVAHRGLRSGRRVGRRGRRRRGGGCADRDVGDQSGPVGGGRRHPAGAGRAGSRRARRRWPKRSRSWDSGAAAADRRDADRRGVHRVVHERAAVGFARGRARARRTPGRVARARARRPRLAGGRGRGGTRGTRTRSSAARDSNGGAPAARCAWP